MADSDGSSGCNLQVNAMRSEVFRLEEMLFCDSHGFAPEIRQSLEEIHRHIDTLEGKLSKT